MERLRTRVGLAALVMLSAMPLKAPAQTSENAPTESVTASVPGWRSREDLATAPAMAIGEAIGKRDPNRMRRAAHELLTAPRAQGGSEMHAANDEGACAIGCEPVPAGDLDGDGADDLIVAEVVTDPFDGPAKIVMTARHASDAAMMWERDFSPSTLYWTVAPTIKGIEGDLVVLEFVYRTRWIDQVVRRIDGATGADVWSKTFVSLGLEAGLLLAIELVPASEAHGAAVLAGVINGWLGPTITYTGTLLNAATGVDMGSATAVGAGANPVWVGGSPFPYVTALPRADMLGRVGLAAISQVQGDSLVVVTVPGEPAPLWTARVPAPPSNDPSVMWNIVTVTPLVNDLDGDAISDLLVVSYAYLEGLPWDECATGAYCSLRVSMSVTALDGGTGSARWNRFLPFGFPFDVTPLEDGAEIRVVQFPTDFDVLSLTLDGATGADLARARYEAPVPGGTFGYAMACTFRCRADLDGDGSADLLTTFVGTMPSGDPAVVPVVALGRSGALWSRDRGAPDEFPLPVGGDVDGDGGEDLAVHRVIPRDDGSVVIQTTVISGLERGTLWNASFTLTPRFGERIGGGVSTMFAAITEHAVVLILHLSLREGYRFYDGIVALDANGLRWRL